MTDIVKRDLSPGASERFIQSMQRSMDTVMRHMQAAQMAGCDVGMVYSEHRDTRGIRSMKLVVAS